MAKTNQIIENQVMGDKVKFLITSEDSNGALLKMEIWCKAGAKGTPLHYHPMQSESFHVLKGKLGIYDNDKEIILAAGEKYTIPVNSKHRFWNASNEEEVSFMAELKPAKRAEFFFETMYALAKEGKVDKEAVPGTLQFAAILNEYYGELFAVGPPIPAQKFMAKVIGGFAKMLGYKGYIPYR